LGKIHPKSQGISRQKNTRKTTSIVLGLLPHVPLRITLGALRMVAGRKLILLVFQAGPVELGQFSSLKL